MLGAKLFFDFSGKYPFEKSFGGLIKELRGRGRYSPSQSQDNVCEPADKLQDHSDTSLKESTSSPKQKPAEHLVVKIANCVSPLHEMTNEQVVQWLQENKLEACVADFAQFDGVMLLQLNEMRKEEFD